jgi:hypothetical protein
MRREGPHPIGEVGPIASKPQSGLRVPRSDGLMTDDIINRLLCREAA